MVRVSGSFGCGGLGGIHVGRFEQASVLTAAAFGFDSAAFARPGCAVGIGDVAATLSGHASKKKSCQRPKNLSFFFFLKNQALGLASQKRVLTHTGEGLVHRHE